MEKEIKKTLESYQKTQQELQALLLHRESVIAKGTKTVSVVSDMPKPKGRVSKMVEEAGVELADMEDIEDKISDCKERHKELLSMIYLLEDAEQRAVLIHRYVSGMEWGEICNMMSYGWDAVHSRHRKAIKELERTVHIPIETYTD